jgi:hypothetical protein
MRFIHGTAAVGTAVAVQIIAPIVLMGAAPAHADLAGYRNCVGNIEELPLQAPEPKNMHLAGVIEQDLNSGVPPAAEAQKIAQRGFDARVANAIVQCVIEERP